MTISLLIEDLMAKLMVRPGMIVLRNPEGTVELKGDDLILKEHGDWVTVYHGTDTISEKRSHLHMRKKGYAYACVREVEGYTAHMTFWKTKEDFCEDKPPFAMYFPTFYDWTDGKTELPEHKEYFEKWVAKHGRHFELI
jgi:hypothetical protein